MKFLIAIVLVLAANVSVESRGRIFGGSIANSENFKYHAQIIIPVANAKFKYQASMCGGSLISNFWILTAAHCFQDGDKNKTYASLGLNKYHQFTKKVNAQKVIIHENYFINKSTVINDIALIYIPYVGFNQYIKKIPLSGSNNIVGKMVTVAGWGLTGTRSQPIVLQVITLKVIDDRTCKKGLGRNFLSSQFCTWDSSKDTCSGDSGGPVTAIFESMEKQVGLVSYGLSDDCSGGKPSSYTRIYSYLEWIYKNSGVFSY